MNRTKAFFIAVTLLVTGALYFGKQPVGRLPNSSEPTYFAEIGTQGDVLRVIVADQSFIDSGAVGNPENWIQTDVDGKIKKNYAGKGYTYDKNRDAFIPPKPEPNATLDEKTAQWKFSKKYLDDLAKIYPEEVPENSIEARQITQ